MSRNKRDYSMRRFRKEYGDVDFEEIDHYPTINRPFWIGKSLDWWSKRIGVDSQRICKTVLLPTIKTMLIDKIISSEESDNMTRMINSPDNEDKLMAISAIEYKLR